MNFEHGIFSGNGIFLWGNGIFGEFTVPQQVFASGKDIGAGATFTVIVDKNDGILSWGSNLNGELGIGDFESRNNATYLISLQGKKVSKLACGSNFTIALGEDIRYNSAKHRSTTPLRQPKAENFKINLHESPKTEYNENITFSTVIYIKITLTYIRVAILMQK